MGGYGRCSGWMIRLLMQATLTASTPRSYLISSVERDGSGIHRNRHLMLRCTASNGGRLWSSVSQRILWIERAIEVLHGTGWNQYIDPIGSFMRWIPFLGPSQHGVVSTGRIGLKHDGARKLPGLYAPPRDRWWHDASVTGGHTILR